jgi:hypothetical protein
MPFRFRAPGTAGDVLSETVTGSHRDRAALLHILDGLLANTRIRAALNTAG